MTDPLSILARAQEAERELNSVAALLGVSRAGVRVAMVKIRDGNEALRVEIARVKLLLGEA